MVIVMVIVMVYSQPCTHTFTLSFHDEHRPIHALTMYVHLQVFPRYQPVGGLQLVLHPQHSPYSEHRSFVIRSSHLLIPRVVRPLKSVARVEDIPLDLAQHPRAQIICTIVIATNSSSPAPSRRWTAGSASKKAPRSVVTTCSSWMDDRGTAIEPQAGGSPLVVQRGRVEHLTCPCPCALRETTLEHPVVHRVPRGAGLSSAPPRMSVL